MINKTFKVKPEHENYRQLFTFARTALEKAYAPYSHFRVGAAIEADDGKVYAGCNVENVSYPCGTCAEAGAVAAMVCGGSAKIRRILVTSDGAALVAPAAPACSGFGIFPAGNGNSAGRPGRSKEDNDDQRAFAQCL